MIAGKGSADVMGLSENRVSRQRTARVLAGLMASVLLSACGGGGGGGGSTPPPPPPPQTATITGTVAAGAALTGTVAVFDSSTHSQPTIANTAIGAGGQYSVVVTGLTPPFLLQATGQVGGQGPTVTFYSVATSAGTVNITPITTLMALNMAAGNIQTLMTGSAGTLPSLTSADLNTQNTNLDTMLSGVLKAEGLSANYNFSTTTFAVGDTGYSQLVNTVTVNLANPAAVVVTNSTAPATPITIDTDTGTPNGSLDVINGPTTLPVGLTIGGTITGLTASGLQLQNNGADTLSLAANATSFTFATAIASGAGYAVTVKAQPSGQSCVVSNGSGTAANSKVTNVTVACTANAVLYTVSGTISGLTVAGLIIQDNGGDDLLLAAGATTFSFATSLASSSTYQVTIKTLVAGEVCSVTNGSGSITNANIVNVVITCTPYYSLGGTVSNLKGATLILLLQNNVGFAENAMSVVPGQSVFVFGTLLTQGAGYTVTVQQQPSGQACTVTNGSGTVSGKVSSITVSCVTVAQWAWISGDDTSLSAVYGTLGKAAVGNTPGGRGQSATSVDTSGNLWLFGGANAGNELTNDLWFYSKSTGEWTWVGGPSSPNTAAIYGTKGIAASANIPGARFGALSWTDSAGNFWLFGGQGYDSTGTQGWLSDLWEYSSVTGQWMWVSGSSIGNAPGVYGSAGVAAANNQPSGRYYAVGWIDAGNNLWLYGGAGIDVSGNQNTLNDLWKFDAGTGLWAWINGSPNGYVTGVYGAQGAADSANAPGSRQQATAWTDSAGQLWLFGGFGLDASATYDALNDLWRYSPASGLWTWMGGSKIVDAKGVYGVQGVAGATNIPGARYASSSWTDVNGALWLLGGEGYDSITPYSNIQNDVWTYDTVSGEWTWTAGGNADGGGDPGTYQVQGLPAAGNVPGARSGALSWADASGSWLYGGDAASPLAPGATSYSISPEANDLWHFGPAIFYNGTGSMTGTFTDQNSCKYTAVATIVNANVTMSTPNAGAVTIAFLVRTFNAQSSNAASCPSYQSYTNTVSIPIIVNGSTVQTLPGSMGTVSGTLSGGAISATVSLTLTGAQGSGTFALTESGSFSTVAVPVTVPNVVGLNEENAVAAIDGGGLQVGTVTHQNSDTVPAGGVISETPAANSTVTAGSGVSLTISVGPASETVPNIVGLTQSAATGAITAAGLSVGTVTQQNSATAPSGAVISETPAAGVKAPTGSTVNFVVSLGPLLVAVPDVTGLSQSSASSAITGAGLTVGSITQQTSTTVPSGYVISETPAVNGSAVAGASVNLVVASVSAPVSVPNVVGVDQATAVSSITGAGLTVGTVTLQTSATVPAGSVIGETPSAASGVASSGAVGLVVSLGAQGIMMPVASPDVVQPGAATSIVVHATVNLPNLVASSVTVQLVNLAGSAHGVLGQLNDSGTNGDMTAGDGVYSGAITLSPAAAGRIWIQVTAQQAGTSSLVVSLPIPIDVLLTGVPTGPFPSDLSTPDTDPATGNLTARNEILTCLIDSGTPAGALAMATLVGAVVVGHVSTPTNCYQLLLPSGSGPTIVRNAVGVLMSQPIVLSAEPEFLASSLGSNCIIAVCNDFSYALLGFNTLKITAQRAPAVALIDSGADFNNPNLSPYLIAGPNFITQSVYKPNDISSQDDFGHGTAVGSIIASVNPLGNIYVVKVLDSSGHGTVASVMAGIRDATERQDVKVLNLSLKTGGPTDIEPDLARQIYVAEAVGDIVVVAAGNDSLSDPNFPASLSAKQAQVISVSGVNDSGSTEDGLSTGYRDIAYSDSNLNASIAAPAVRIGTESLPNGMVPPYSSGTSLAAPFVAATAALIEAQYPSLSAAAVKSQLLASAVPIYYLNSSYGIIDQHLLNPGEKGQGRLDPVAALGAIRLTHTGFVDGNELDAVISSTAHAAIFPQPYPILGTVGAIPGDLNPADLICEARTFDNCTYDWPLQPLPPGNYQINLSVPVGSSNDFPGEFTVTVPGLEIVSCNLPNGAKAENGTVVDAQHGAFALVGANGNQRFANFCLVQGAF
jgi:beta-lactam-binding protein with PASTA domain